MGWSLSITSIPNPNFSHKSSENNDSNDDRTTFASTLNLQLQWDYVQMQHINPLK